MPMETINVVEAKSRFSELISRAASGERFIIQRRERPVAALIGTTELERLERTSLRRTWLALALPPVIFLAVVIIGSIGIGIAARGDAALITARVQNALPVMLLVVQLLLAGLFLWRRSLWAPFSAHLALNLVEFLFVWLAM